MASRLLWLNKVLLPILILFFIAHTPSYAQNFSFSYLGPDSLFVGNDCTAPYQFDGNDIIVASTNGDSVYFEYDYARAGINYGDPVQAGNSVTMYVPVWDNQGNTDTFTFDIQFLDTLAPIFDASSLPANYPFYVSLADVPPPANVTASDNCGPVNINFSQSTLMDTCAGGSFYRTWTAVDTFGNQSIFTQTLVLVADDTPPQITAWPNNGQSACELFSTNYPVWLAQNMNTIQANDPSGIASITNNSPTDITFLCDTNFVVTFTVTDSCGNSKNAVASYQVIDTTPPIIINIPQDTTYNCGQIEPALHLNTGLTAIDCNQNLIEIFSESDTQNPNPESCNHYNYTIIRNWTIRDHCANETSFQQIVTVQDTLAPSFIDTITDLTVQCQDVPDFIDLEAVDECSGINYQKNETINLGNCTENYEIIRTWVAIDACGNQEQLSQTITVQDTIAPLFVDVPIDTIVSCGHIPNLPVITATDNCDNNVSIIYNESSTQASDSTSCNYYNYTIHRNWIAADNCGNTTQASQQITVVDSTPPTILCPTNQVLLSDSLTCSKNMLIPNPASFFDDCTFSVTQESLSNTVDITHPAGTDANTTPVNLNIILNTTNPTSSITENIQLTINLNEVDAESATEYFRVYGENNTLIGQTNHTPNQCGSSTTTFTNISVQQLAQWLDDGSIEITLLSAGNGEDAINDICPNGTVSATLSYDFATPNLPLNIRYAIDENPLENWPNPTNFDFDEGIHTVQYFAEDCSGNMDSCAFQIQIQDAELPVITCPLDTTIYVSSSECQSKVYLPYPLNISDNCSFSSMFYYQADTIPIVFTNNGNAGLIPENMTFDITGVTSNAINDAQLNIYFKGDNANAGEHFLIYGENNTFLGQTVYGSNAEECNQFVSTTIQVSKDSLNEWASDGHLLIHLVPETDAGTYTDFINPCPNETSFVSLTLDYENTTIQYQLGDTSGYVLAAKPTSLDLSPNVYPVEYSVLDNSGNKGTCQWNITILDTIAPTAIALNTIVTVNPSGTTSSSIDPNIVNSGSYDNCEIVSMTLTPETFTCDQAGNTLPIILTVTDPSGNIGTDTALVQIKNEPPNPVFSQGVCGNDTLFLFANPPATNGGIVYSYDWTGPNGFSSQEANPYIPNPTIAQTGSYSVTITGFTGCTSSNSVQVQLNALPDPPILTTNTTSVCPGESVTLSTQGFAGSSVHYHWYQGLPPNGLLLGTTTTNAFTIPNPAPGQFNYYAVVNINGCQSSQSNVVSIIINPEINLEVTASSISVCQGSQVNIGINNPVGDVQYSWNGPNLFTSTNAITHFTASDTSQTGMYIISAEKNGCIYQPDTTFVTVLQTPNVPVIATNSPLCESDTLQLNVNNYVANHQLHWHGPNGIDTIIQSESIQFIGDINQSGTWSVYMDDGTCSSNTGQIEIFVNKVPSLSIEPVGNVCLGNVMTLAYTSTPNTSDQTWTGPNQFWSKNQVEETIAIEGMYYLNAKTSAGCESNDSIWVSPKIPPKITAISNTSDGCYNGELIQLKPSVFPPDTSYMYQWTGPNAYTAIVAEPFISNANESINGYYNLVVTNTFGCVSEEKSTFVTGTNIPKMPILVIDNPSVCEGEPISLTISNDTAYSGTAMIDWLTPKGSLTNSNTVLTLSGTDALDEGQYYAIVSEGNCQSDTSNGTYLSIKPRPAKPVGSSNSPICSGETLHLTTNQIQGAVYYWSGQAGSLDSIYNPTISKVQKNNHEGNYFVQTSLDGCTSEISDPINVIVKDLPTQPIIDFESPVCYSGGKINLQVSETSQVPGGLYTWILAPDDTVVHASFFTKYSTNDSTIFHPGNNYYVATVEHDGCTNISDTITVVVDEIPINQADAGLDILSCANQTVFLEAQWPTNGTGMWSQICGDPLSITNPDTSFTTITDMIPDAQYCFEWSLSYGGCKNYSKDTVFVDISTPVEANAGIDIDTCDVTTVLLNAQNTMGKWTQSQEQANSGMIKITEKYNPQTPITGLEKGNLYTFYWEIIDMTCGSSIDSMTIRIAAGKPDAGPDQLLCSLDSCITLNAAPLGTFDVGQWSTFDSASDILQPSSENSVACNLAIGSNPFVWTLNNASCGDASKDTVIIHFQPTPVAHPDTFDIDYGRQSVIDVSTNDEYYSSYTINITTPPSHCKLVSEEPDGSIKLEPYEAYVGLDFMSYEICNEACGACTETTVELRIGTNADCQVPTIFTPDQDGINDYLVIPCLLGSEYNNSELSIFNQWGDEIYHAKNYQNNWDGTYRGTHIQEGTYYYLFNLGDGTAPKKGFITIKY